MYSFKDDIFLYQLMPNEFEEGNNHFNIDEFNFLPSIHIGRMHNNNENWDDIVKKPIQSQSQSQDIFDVAKLKKYFSIVMMTYIR